MSTAVAALVIVTAVGAACTGGVLFAFSSFVMPALRRLPPAQGVAAMQSINVTAVRAAVHARVRRAPRCSPSR